MKCLRRWIAQFAVSVVVMPLLGACGGAGDDTPPAANNVSPSLKVVVQGCDAVSVHDTGQVLYLILARTCPELGGAQARRQIALAYSPESPMLGSTPEQLQLAEGEEQSDVAIAGLGQRRVGLFRQGTWRNFPNTDSWSGRDGAGLLVLRGELYLLGGWAYGPTSSEVWKTSDLEHWKLLTTAPWPGRHGSGWLVHDDRLWVIGGDLNDDVWSSPDGITWTQTITHAPFGRRYTPNAASLGGYIVVYAGQYWTPIDWCSGRSDCAAVGRRDVWRSRDGVNWEQGTPEAPWMGRGLIHGSIVHGGEIYLVGGGLKVVPPDGEYSETSAEFTDIWSSADGISWRKRLDKFSFTPRTHFSALSTPAGCYVSDGSVGTQVNLSNDLFFAPDCINYAPVPDTPPLQRRHASSLAYWNGSIVILGGPSNFQPGTMVWQYFP